MARSFWGTHLGLKRVLPGLRSLLNAGNRVFTILDSNG